MPTPPSLENAHARSAPARAKAKSDALAAVTAAVKVLEDDELNEFRADVARALELDDEPSE